MNAHSTIKPERKLRKNMTLRGIGTITFDHNMRNHRMRTDSEAIASDWRMVGSDLRWAFKSASLTHEPA